MPDQPIKQSYYFSHDSNARNDKNIIKLRRKLGMEGYGIYWCIIEILREEANHKMQLSRIDDIAFQIGSSVDMVNDVINSYQLFKIENDIFYSESLIRRMEMYKDVKTKLSEAGKKGAAKRWNDTGAPTLKKVSDGI